MPFVSRIHTVIGEEWLTRPWTEKLLLLETPPILLNKMMAIKRQKQADVSKRLFAIDSSAADLTFIYLSALHQICSLSSAALRDDLSINVI